MRFTRRIKRTRSGVFELRLSPEERDVLRGLPTQMRDALELGKDDPAVARLNPSACLDDAEVEATVDAPRLDEEEALAWMRAINDVRLLLGTRLDVTDDPGQRQVSPDDPRAPGFALYDYLSLLTQELVEALDS